MPPSAVKIEYYPANHPKLIKNQIKSIPLVKKKIFDLQTEFLKNLKIAHIYDKESKVMQRAAAKSALVKLDRTSLRKLRDFKKVKIE